jgi:hypothetical protein
MLPLNEIFGTKNRNTEDEVLALKDWAEKRRRFLA